MRIRRGETRPRSFSPRRSWERGHDAAAESCTGGLIGKYMTDLPGSSRVFWGGLLRTRTRRREAARRGGVDVVRSTELSPERWPCAMALGVLVPLARMLQSRSPGSPGPDGGTRGEAGGDRLDRRRAARWRAARRDCSPLGVAGHDPTAGPPWRQCSSPRRGCLAGSSLTCAQSGNIFGLKEYLTAFQGLRAILICKTRFHLA